MVTVLGKIPKANPPVPKDLLKRVGPAADCLNMSNVKLTVIMVFFFNDKGNAVDDITLSTSSARRHRAASRKELAW